MEPEVNRAGMIAFNLAGQVLIVTALTNDNLWVFPKGHIEKGETIQDAAVREALEETGIMTTSLFKAYTSSYLYKKEKVVVEWWAGCAVRKAEVQPNEFYLESDYRKIKWASVEEALNLLSFEDLRSALRKAVCWD